MNFQDTVVVESLFFLVELYVREFEKFSEWNKIMIYIILKLVLFLNVFFFKVNALRPATFQSHYTKMRFLEVCKIFDSCFFNLFICYKSVSQEIFLVVGKNENQRERTKK